MLRQFEKVKDLDSRTFVEIPQKQIVKPSDYRRWLVEEIEYKWMTEFNSKNTHYRPCFRFNEESGIGGYFGEEYISHSKLYRYDGTHYGISEDDFRAKRGILIRDHYSELKAAGYSLLGVSADTEKKQKNFADKFEFPFPLLADTEKDVIEAFGVWGPKQFMGKNYDGIHRKTFIIDEKGIVLRVIDKVKTKEHAAQILED